jgi:hypothetical protein
VLFILVGILGLHASSHSLTRRTQAVGALPPAEPFRPNICKGVLK